VWVGEAVVSRGKILVIDDEPGIVDIVATNLEAEGFEVIGAGDGKAGLRLAKDQDPDLVILDIMLPGIDGWEVLRRLEADRTTSGVPVIMLTAKVEDTDVLQGLEGGAVEYVTKPFFPEDLVATVKIHLTVYDRSLRAERRSALIERRRSILKRAPRNRG